MSKQKYFSSFLQEALSPEQQVKVDQWVAKHKTASGTTPAEELSKDVFQGHEVLMHPLHHVPVSHDIIHPAVQDHLQKHGYHIPSGDEYRSGYAVDKHDRITSIGKALNKTGADESLKSAFMNDPLRASGKNTGLSVAYTWHPHHVAGMSTDRGWTSCMDMSDSDGNMHHLENDISQGTHAAYLVHSDDTKIERPLARIALKPFNSIDGHTVLVPEQKTYGTGSGAFSKAVDSWTDTHFPMKKNTLYRIHHGLYQDSHTGFADYDDATIHGHMADAMRGGLSSDGFIRNDLSNPKNVHTAITHVLGLKPEDAKNPDNIKNDKAYVVNKILSGTGRKVHPDTLGHIVDAMKSGVLPEGHEELIHSLAHNHGTMMHPKAASDVLDMATKSSRYVSGDTPSSVLHNSGISSDQILKAVHSGSVDIHTIPSNKYTPELIDHIHKKMDDQSSDVFSSNALSSKHMTEPLISDIAYKAIGSDNPKHHMVRMARFLSNSESKDYTLDVARDLDKMTSRSVEGEDHYGISVMHKDATPEDLEHHLDNVKGGKISGSTWRNIKSPAVLDHAFESRMHQSDMIDSIYQHGVNNKAKNAPTMMSAATGLPTGTHNIARMVGDAEPGKVRLESQRLAAYKNVVDGSNYLSHHPEHHHAIRKAVDTAIKYGDYGQASKMIATTHAGNVSFQKTHIETVSNATGHDLSHVPTTD